MADEQEPHTKRRRGKRGGRRHRKAAAQQQEQQQEQEQEQVTQPTTHHVNSRVKMVSMPSDEQVEAAIKALRKAIGIAREAYGVLVLWSPDDDLLAHRYGSQDALPEMANIYRGDLLLTLLAVGCASPVSGRPPELRLSQRIATALFEAQPTHQDLERAAHLRAAILSIADALASRHDMRQPGRFLADASTHGGVVAFEEIADGPAVCPQCVSVQGGTDYRRLVETGTRRAETSRAITSGANIYVSHGPLRHSTKSPQRV